MSFFMWAARILLAWSIQPRKLRTCLLLREHAHSLACTQPAVSFYYYLLVGSVLKKIEDLFYQINIASYQIVSVLNQNSFWLQVCSTKNDLMILVVCIIFSLQLPLYQN